MEKTMEFPKIKAFDASTASERLNEIYQNMDLKFSFLSKQQEDGSFIECNIPAKCRDYFHDIVNSMMTGKGFAVYGMVYDPVKFPIDMDSLRMKLKFPTAKAKTCWLENLWFLYEIEEKNKFKPTEVTQLEDNLCVMIAADPQWRQNAVILSVFTYLHRILNYKFETKDIFFALPSIGGVDGQYFIDLREGILKKVLDDLSLIKFETFLGFSKERYIGTIHNSSGFVSVLSKGTSCHLNKENAHYIELRKRGVV